MDIPYRLIGFGIFHSPSFPRLRRNNEVLGYLDPAVLGLDVGINILQ